MRRRGHVGPGLVAAGLALGVVYVVLIWYGVYANDTADQVCGVGAPHRDHFFPPYTSCGAGSGFRATSTLAEYAGAGLFVLVAATLISGVVVMIKGVDRREGRANGH